MGHRLGQAFVALTLALRIPVIAILLLGLALMVGHALLTSLLGNDLWWTVLLRSDDIESAGRHFYVSYPVLPWFGVMVFGYGIAMSISLWQKRVIGLRRTIGGIGIALLIAFVSLRYANWGDPGSWAHLARTLFTILSFVNLEKYPPSIDFLLMTLGVMFCCLALIDFLPNSITRSFSQSWSGTAFLLSDPHCSYSRLGHRSCVHPVWTRRMAISRARHILVGNAPRASCELRPIVDLGGRTLGGGNRHSLSRLLGLWLLQTNARSGLAPLSLARIGFRRAKEA
jgi:hypothetical protein